MHDPEAIPSDLPSRIVYSLLRGAVRLAGRLGMPLKQVEQLVRLAYYEELRVQHPRDRKAVARRLGVSLRTAAALGSQIKEGFTAPEETLGFARRVRQLIDDAPRTDAELAELLDEDPERIAPVLQTLAANGWTEQVRGRWRIKTSLQSYLGGALDQKIDGLARQQDVTADAAFAAFFGRPESADSARTWVFHAAPEAFAALKSAHITALRSDVIGLDEAAVHSEDARRVGVTIVFSEMNE